MTNLITRTTAKHVIVSYSTDGIIPEDELLSLLQQNAKDKKVNVKKIEYRKYKGKIHNNNKVYELLFYYQPKKYKSYKQESLFTVAPQKEMKWNPKRANTKFPASFLSAYQVKDKCIVTPENWIDWVIEW